MSDITSIFDLEALATQAPARRHLRLRARGVVRAGDAARNLSDMKRWPCASTTCATSPTATPR